MAADFVEVTVCPECDKEVEALVTKYVCEICDTLHPDEEAAKLCCAEPEEEAEEVTD